LLLLYFFFVLQKKTQVLEDLKSLKLLLYLGFFFENHVARTFPTLFTYFFRQIKKVNERYRKSLFFLNESNYRIKIKYKKKTKSKRNINFEQQTIRMRLKKSHLSLN
jgi:hypothetical protein